MGNDQKHNNYIDLGAEVNILGPIIESARIQTRQTPGQNIIIIIIIIIIITVAAAMAGMGSAMQCKLACRTCL
jgi:hypothetical protein